MPFLVAIEAGMAVVGLVALAIGLLHAASLISFARAP
jgi:hypothetical protein